MTEVVRAFGIRESDFQRIGGAWVYKITGKDHIRPLFSVIHLKD